MAFFKILFFTILVVKTADAQSVESRNHIFIKEGKALGSWFGNSITLVDSP